MASVLCMLSMSRIVKRCKRRGNGGDGFCFIWGLDFDTSLPEEYGNRRIYEVLLWVGAWVLHVGYCSFVYFVTRQS
jgi:hypothetical protein